MLVFLSLHEKKKKRDKGILLFSFFMAILKKKEKVKLLPREHLRNFQQRLDKRDWAFCSWKSRSRVFYTYLRVCIQRRKEKRRVIRFIQGRKKQKKEEILPHILTLYVYTKAITLSHSLHWYRDYWKVFFFLHAVLEIVNIVDRKKDY